jgi:hypothetical protein
MQALQPCSTPQVEVAPHQPGATAWQESKELRSKMSERIADVSVPSSAVEAVYLLPDAWHHAAAVAAAAAA